MTEQALCTELRRDLPSYSRKDTRETLRSGERFVRSFNAACGVKGPK